MSEDRKTFTVPDGFEAIFSVDGRPTGKVRKTRETLEREVKELLENYTRAVNETSQQKTERSHAERKVAELEAERDNAIAMLETQAKLHRRAEAREARLSEGWPVPDGWKLVPVEPDNAMIDAGAEDVPVYVKRGTRRIIAIDTYRAMIAASPAAPQQGGE